MIMLAVFLWLLAAAAFIIIEIVTLGLTSIWFAGGSIVAAISAAAGAGYMIQLILFAIVSVVLLIFTRPIAAKHLTGHTIKTNADNLIGKIGIVQQEINNLDGQGVVIINGQEWTARSIKDDCIIPASKHVVIRKISGVKLIVELEKEEIVS